MKLSVCFGPWKEERRSVRSLRGRGREGGREGERKSERETEEQCHAQDY